MVSDEYWTPDRLRAFGATVRMQCWPLSERIKEAMYSAAKQIEELEIPAPTDMDYYRTQAEKMIGFSRCGYLDLRAYEKLVKVLSESLAETAMVCQEHCDAIAVGSGTLSAQRSELLNGQERSAIDEPSNSPLSRSGKEPA